MANFQTIAAGILEKNGIVARSFVISWAFDIPSSRLDDDFSQPVYFAGTISPEGDPALVGDMQWRLSDTKELRGIVRFELQPALDPNVACEPKRRKECDDIAVPRTDAR